MRLVLALMLATAVTAAPADPVTEVRDAEIAFARAFADRDREAFFAFVADDATFLSAGSTLSGKARVIEGWSPLLEGPAPFSWAPDRVSVTSDGRLGLSTGPVHDPKGRHVGDYISTWRRDPSGAWKIVFDSSGPGPAVLPEHLPEIEEGFIPTPDGVRLFYRRIGRRPVTVIAPLDSFLFDQLRQLSNVATVITYDLRNRGRSGRADGVTIQHDVRDLETVRAHFKVERFVPIGFSYLGKMVAMYAAAHPERVARLVQVAPLGNHPVRVPPVSEFGAPAEDVRAWQAMEASGGIEKTPKEACVAFWKFFRYYMVGDPDHASRLDPEKECEHPAEWPVNVNPHFKSLLGSPASLEPEAMKRISMPVLIIHGTADRQAAYADGAAWARELPEARLLTVKGAAHAVWLDDPAAVLAALRAFLRGEWPLGSEIVKP